jgi:hypothetical protein
MEPGEADVAATVFWYGSRALPSGSTPVTYEARRLLFMGHMVGKLPSPEEWFDSILADPNPQLAFDTAADFERVILRQTPDNYPRWVSGARDKIGFPNPGRSGIGVLAGPSGPLSCHLYWKVKVPPSAHGLHYELCADPHRPGHGGDVGVHLSVSDGHHTTLLRSLHLVSGGPPAESGWSSDTLPFGQPGGEVLVILDVYAENAQPGDKPHELFIDRLAVE